MRNISLQKLHRLKAQQRQTRRARSEETATVVEWKTDTAVVNESIFGINANKIRNKLKQSAQRATVIQHYNDGNQRCTVTRSCHI